MVKNTLKSGFFRISGKSGSRIRNFFGLKPSRDQDGANKKKYSQIGPAVPEEIGNRQTNKHANIVLLYKRDGFLQNSVLGLSIGSFSAKKLNIKISKYRIKFDNASTVITFQTFQSHLKKQIIRIKFSTLIWIWICGVN